MMIATLVTLATALAAAGPRTVASNTPSPFSPPSPATTIDANGKHHLWFRSTDPVLGWCGEVDAAPYMPAEIFQPRHVLSLIAYAELTTKLYTSPPYSNGDPSRNTPLVVGRCSGIDYNLYNGVLSGITWFGDDTLMGPVCAEQCGCNFEGQSKIHLPACEDVPDDPSTGSFCSLCGPTTACPGCSSPDLVGNIFLFKEGPAECLPRGCACSARQPGTPATPGCTGADGPHGPGH